MDNDYKYQLVNLIQQIELIKEPLLMSGGSEINNLEELQCFSDINGILSAFYSGKLLKFCIANGYTDLIGQLQELNNLLISTLYKIFDIELKEDELNQYYKSVDNKVYKRYNENNCDFLEQNDNISEEFKIFCKDENISLNYDVTFIPVEKYDGTVIYYRILVIDKFYDIKFEYYLPYNKSNKDLFFKNVSNILRKLNQILPSICMVTSCSGKCGYGLELI